MADITTTHLVGGGGGDGTAAWAGFWAEVALLLDDHDDAFAWEELEEFRGMFGWFLGIRGR